MKNDYCKRCGKCCEAICLCYSYEQLKLYEDNEEAKELVKIFEPITQEEALEINPHLQVWINKSKNGRYFYRCTQYDKGTKLCRIHDSKQRICTEFPFYGKEKLPSHEEFYSEDCGYNREDLKELQK